MQGVELSEPFFHQTVARLRQQLPTPEETFTDFETLLALAESFERVVPTGFIFHSSRCGSTLVANACRMLDASVVVSEARAIDKLIGRLVTDAPLGSTKELIYLALVRAVVSTFAQHRPGGRFFVKFSCCSTLELARIRRIWPDVPGVFLYRDSQETIASNVATVPEWLVDPDRRLLTAITGLDESDLAPLTIEELCARSLATFYSVAEQMANDKTILVNYNQLSLSTLMRLMRFFGVELSREEVERISKVAEIYSKDPTGRRAFVGDEKAKQQGRSQLISEVAQTWALKPYLALEAKRKAFQNSKVETE